LINDRAQELVEMRSAAAARGDVDITPVVEKYREALARRIAREFAEDIVVEKIADREAIVVTEQEVEDAIRTSTPSKFNVQDATHATERTIEELTERRLMPHVRFLLLKKKTLAFLRENANVVH